jgi:3-oxoacyl-[acyl-carrier protein] reductase
VGPAVAADLSEPDAAGRLVDAAENHFGPINALVNNAAHCETPDDVDSLTAESLERHYRVNTIAPALLISEVARRHRAGTPLCVVNISRRSYQRIGPFGISELTKSPTVAE